MSRDIEIVRALAEQYAELAALPVQDERRRLWTDHLSLDETRPPVIATYGTWNVWCREVFGDQAMECEDPFWREQERSLRMALFHHDIGDDYVLEPWWTAGAAMKGSWGAPWGVAQGRISSDMDGGAWKFDPPIKEWSDVEKLSPVPHEIDEEETARRVERLSEAFDGVLPVDVNRSPFYGGFNADISTHLTKLRGLEQLMIDMYESPDELHRLLAFMRDGILAAHEAAEAAGDYSLTSGSNQAMPYARELEPPRPNSGPVARKEIWGFCAAQEYTLVSPEFHDEFLFAYQKPIFEHFGLVHYGCCEDLGRKIDMLRPLTPLRSIAVTPVADVRLCAEQIGPDYVYSWRPNPTDMVCCGFDEELIRRIVRECMEAARANDCRVHIHLKDIETVEGDVSRLRRWTDIVRDECGKGQ